jgi:steroid delta-isomerase-like uncharacterized protein
VSNRTASGQAFEKRLIHPSA